MFSRMRKVIKLHFYNKRNGSGIKSCDVSLRAFLGFGFGLGVEVLLILTVGWGSIVMLAGIVTLPSR